MLVYITTKYGKGNAYFREYAFKEKEITDSPNSPEGLSNPLLFFSYRVLMV